MQFLSIGQQTFCFNECTAFYITANRMNRLYYRYADFDIIVLPVLHKILRQYILFDPL